MVRTITRLGTLALAILLGACAIAAAKGGVEALVRSAAATCAAQGVRVNAVAPGMTDTPMTAGMLKVPAMREGAARQYPLGSVQSAEQVADTMAWLLGTGAWVGSNATCVGATTPGWPKPASTAHPLR